jgi:septum formation protein
LTLILASSSPIRRQMLDAAGVEHSAVPSNIDEDLVKARHERPEQLALELAAAKALAVSRADPDAWTIGSDSVAAVQGIGMFDKPSSREQAAEHLRRFSERRMRLTSAVALAHQGSVEWNYAEDAYLYVRSLSDEFIEQYLEAEWPEVGQCVGVFRLEGRGVQLFDRIDGDYFTILGMPLVPLLRGLRERKLIAA